MRYLVTIPVFLVAGFCFYKPCCPSDEYTPSNGARRHTKYDGLVLNWFGRRPNIKPLNTCKLKTLTPKKIRFDVQPTVRLTQGESEELSSNG